MSSIRSYLAQHPLLTGAALFVLAALGSGVGIIASLAWHDRNIQTPIAAVLQGRPAPVSGSLADMVEAVVPSVVQVQVTGVRGHGGLVAPGNSAQDRLRRFFGDLAPEEQNPETQGPGEEVLGSGFIVDQQGIIVTNAHVVAGGERIRVRLADGREVPASLVGVDVKTDLAVLRINATGLNLVRWGNSDAVRVGDPIFAVGSPFGLGSTVTSGIVSGRGREIGEGPYDDFLQIDAAINQGNSGGPLFDARGQVIGVNTAIFSPSNNGGNVGIGFAIPAQMVQAIVKQLVTSGRVIRGQIGVSIQPVTAEIADSLGLDEASGALVAAVMPGSPAANAGIIVGDVIERFGAVKVTGARDLTRVVAGSTVGSTQEISVRRSGNLVALKIVVAESDRPQIFVKPVAAPVNPNSGTAMLGMKLVATTPALNAQAEQRIDAKGVMVARVEPGSKSAEYGLSTGDLIISINYLRVDSLKTLESTIAAAARAGRHNVLLEVERGGDRAFIALPLHGDARR